jgi:prefoldin subunit 5
MANQNIVITTKVEGLQAIERLNKEIDELKSVSDKASKEVTRLKSKIDRDLARAAAKSAKQIDKLQAKMERGLARAAARTTLQIDKLKSKIDRDLARAAAKSAKQIDRLEDKIKSLRVATRRTGDATSTTSDKFDKMGGQFSKVGGLGGELGGVFDALSVTMSGPLGLAIGAVTVGLGAAFAVTRQVNQSFENMVARADEAGRALTDLEESVVGANARMEASEKRLTESFDNFVVEFTGGAKKLDAEAAVFDVLAGHLEKFAGLLVNTQPVVAYAQAVQSLGQTALVAAANYDQFNLTFGMGADAAEAFSQNLDTLVDVHNEGAAAFESGGLISLIDGIGNAASMAADKFFDLADSVRSAVNEMSSVSDKALKGIKKPKRRRRRGGGGRKRKTKAERRQESGLAMVEDLAIADEPFDAVDAAALGGSGSGTPRR